MPRFDSGIDDDDKIPEAILVGGEGEELVDHFMTVTTYWIIAFMISFIMFLVFCCKSLSNYVAIRDLKQHQHTVNDTSSSSSHSNKKRK